MSEEDNSSTFEVRNDDSKMFVNSNKQSDFNDFVFIDVQGFRTKSCYKHNYIRFICKEFCMIDGDDRFHAIVKSPYSFNKIPSYYQRQVGWLTRNFHGLTYDCGDTSINEVVKNTYPKIKDKIVLVKGSEKIQWLQYIYRKTGVINCENIEDIDFDLSLENPVLYEICNYHNDIYGWCECRCALSNAIKIRDITFNNLCKNDNSSVAVEPLND